MDAAAKAALVARLERIQSVGGSLLSNATLALQAVEAIPVDTEPTPEPTPDPDPTPVPSSGLSAWGDVVSHGVDLDPSQAKRAGLPPGASLTTAGSNTVAGGQTITGQAFTGQVEITGSDVTFTRCRFEAAGWVARQSCGDSRYVIYVPDVTQHGIRFIDCEFYGGQSIASYGGNLYQRCYFADGNDLMRVRSLTDPLVLSECVFDGVVRAAPESHCDAIQYTNTGSGSLKATIERCWVNSANRATSELGNAAIQLGGFGDGGGPDGTVTDCFLGGGNYTVNAGKVPASGHRITFRGNRFGRVHRYGPLSGSSPGFDFDASNVWADTLQPI